MSTQNEFAKKTRERLQYAYALTRKILKRSVEKQKKFYNERTFGSPIKVSDVVWCAEKTKKKGVSPKLQPKWKGPGLVTEAYNDVVVKVQFSKRK